MTAVIQIFSWRVSRPKVYRLSFLGLGPFWASSSNEAALCLRTSISTFSSLLFQLHKKDGIGVVDIIFWLTHLCQRAHKAAWVAPLPADWLTSGFRCHVTTTWHMRISRNDIKRWFVCTHSGLSGEATNLSPSSQDACVSRQNGGKWSALVMGPWLPKTTANNCGLPAPTATDYVRKLKSLRPAIVLYIYMARYSRNIRASILQNRCAKTNPHVLFFGRDF